MRPDLLDSSETLLTAIWLAAKHIHKPLFDTMTELRGRKEATIRRVDHLEADGNVEVF